MPATRVWNFWGFGGQLYPGAAAPTQDASHNHPPHRPARTESGSTARDERDRSIVRSAYRNERAIFAVSARNIQGTWEQDRHGSSWCSRLAIPGSEFL